MNNKTARVRIAGAYAVLFFTLSVPTMAGALRSEGTPNEEERLSSYTQFQNNRPFRPGLIRIDFSITTSEPTIWKGDIKLSKGEFGDLAPLGTASSSSVDFLPSNSNKGKLHIRTRARSTFCGVETTVFAPIDANLEINLLDQGTGRRLVKTIPIGRLVDSSIRIPLDDKGNGIEIVRTPADDLPISLEAVHQDGKARHYYETTLFEPGQTARLRVLPRTSSVKLPDNLELIALARKVDSQEPFWRLNRDVSSSEIRRAEALVGDALSVPDFFEFNFEVPSTEGTFEILVELAEKKASSSKKTFAFPSPKRKYENNIIARRGVQAIVVSSAPQVVRSEATHKESNNDLRAELLETIDPTSSTWRKNFSKRSVFPFRKSTPKTNKTTDFFGSNSSRTELDFGKYEGAYAREQSISNSAKFENVPSEQTARNAEISRARLSSEQSTIQLGQVPNGKTFASVPSFGKNFLDISPLLNAQGVDERTIEKSCLERWEKDRFQSFVRGIDQSLWGEIGGLWDKPLSGGTSRPFSKEELIEFATPQSRFLRLEPNRPGKVSWEAYPVPLGESDTPFILEVEYPSNFPQKLGVSILEPSTSGGLFPTYRDMGFAVSKSELSDRATNETIRYSTIFWTRSPTPIILMTNCSAETPAAYGQIRIYKAEKAEVVPDAIPRGRTFGLAMTEPNLCEQFTAPKAPSHFGVTGVETWSSFEKGVSRWLYQLTASNVDSAVLAVVSNGSTLYPSFELNPNPRYDGGIFQTSGGDPVRKNVLRYSLARFNAQHKKITPLVNLNSPLIKLEEKLEVARQGSGSLEVNSKLEGIEWIGADGRRLIDERVQADGSGPYYNILHPVVQDETIAILEEIVNLCSPYDSFDSIALDVGANGWLALPDDVFYGMDDETIARFVRESNLQEILANKSERRVQELLLAKGNERYRFRAEFIKNHCLDEWLNWRVDALYRFYRRARAVIAKSRPDARLYLVATTALDGPICSSTTRPTLTNGKKIREALRLVGLDPARYASEGRKKTLNAIAQASYSNNPPHRDQRDELIALLRPEIVATTTPFSKKVLWEELKDPATISLFNGLQTTPGTFFFHKPQHISLPTFSDTSPVCPAVIELQNLVQPAGYENRERFARALAVEDSLCFFDGGGFIPVGQEETMREWIDAFKQLPNAPFKTWTINSEINAKIENYEQFDETSERTISPLVVRYLRTKGETWIYLVNAAPFHLGVELSLKIKSGSSHTIYPSERREKPKSFGNVLEWNYTSAPYDLTVIKIDDPQTLVEKLEVSRPQEICGADGRLDSAVNNFVERVLAARVGAPLPLENGDFEEVFDNAPLSNNANPNKTEKTALETLFRVETPNLNPFKKQVKSDDAARDANSSDGLDQTQIIGWRAFGADDVEVILDSDVCFGGKTSLRITSKGSAGGVISQPFEAPTSGRLCVQICFGVPETATELSLNARLVGTYNGKPFSRRIGIGSTVLKRAQNMERKDSDKGVIWLRDVVLFDKLPFDGLENLSLCFELYDSGAIWLDQIRPYKLAFADAEQSELMKIINTVEYRKSRGRYLDVLLMLESYWARMLEEQIPDDSPLLAARSRRTVSTAAIPNEATPQKTKKEGPFNKAMNKLRFW